MEEEEELVHFCHGAPGAIPLFLEAHKMYSNDKYLEAALLCGECVW
jgi:membrane transport protein XK